jgi:ferredoxin-NADP reductase
MILKLVRKTKEAKDTMSFSFETGKNVSWLPGQYYYITLPKLSVPDARGATRHFTISVSPTEGNLIRITTRIRDNSGFKQTLAKLNEGEIVEGEGPNGTYILDENEKGNHILLAGGIGITPFRTFIKYNIDNNLTDTKLNLIYANSIPEEIVFRKELESWDKSHENIGVTFTISRPDESKEQWSGLTGRIDENMIKTLTAKYHLPSTIFWVCGPPPMVEATEKILGSLKITSYKVRSEKFTGY